MDLAGKRLLLIGGAGLIGSHTVDQLLQEDVAEIRIYDNFTRGREENLAQALADPRVNIFPLGGDILHRDLLRRAMTGIDGVFHFAALWLLHCYDYPRSAFEVNIAGTFNVLEAMIDSRIRRLVFSSSASVYGDAVREPMDEDHPYANETFYGASKIAGEHMCRALYHRYKNTDRHFNYVGLRYMNVYGPRQDYRGAYIAVIMKMLDRLDQGLPPIVHGDGSQAFDFVSVIDCARANVHALRATATDRCYNVCTGVRTSIRAVAELVLEMTGSPHSIQFEPGQPSFVKNRIGDPRRAMADLGFTARTQLREGLAELIAWRESHKREVEARRQAAGVGA
ncbi:MAG: NAD-dependent epimerase/dehydratase family protein [Magnetococcales bacterium]|nr:NAD-dependent epimerase/dehydratase family protein [Magnetococcales bacterium]